MKTIYYDLKLETINLRMHQIRHLKELRLPKGTFNNEALMLILNKKYRTSDGKRILFKYLDAQDDARLMTSKEKTLAYLNGSEYKKVKELIIPEYIVKVDSKPAGFAMPLVENHKNLGILLESDKISMKMKKEYLIMLGKLIDEVQRVDEKHNFSFSDLNEYNFIINQEGKMNAIDLDSAYIDGIDGINPPELSLYLHKNKNLRGFKDKYPRTASGIVIPNQNSDLYCYNMIILSLLAEEYVHKIDMNLFYQYLEYLELVGVPKELIETWFNLYSKKKNDNPEKYIAEIPDDILKYSRFETFQKVKTVN